MEVRQLQIFLAVADELNFTRAAERCNCVQSNVTAQIQSLEQELGTPLFERLGRKVLLTDAGHKLRPYAERTLGTIDEAKKAVISQDGPRGPLAVGTSESTLTYRLPRALKEFREKYPAVELTFLPCQDNKLLDLLETGKADLVISMLDEVENPQLCSSRVVQEELVFLTSPLHSLVSQGRVTPEDIQDETLLLTESGCAFRKKLDKVIADQGIRPASITEFTSSEAIKECIALGMGVGLLPRIVASSELKEGRLVALPWKGPSFDIATTLVWHKGKWRSAAFTAFVQTVERILRGASS